VEHRGMDKDRIDGAAMQVRHAVIWLDFKEAHVFKFSAEDVRRQRIKAHAPSHKIHQKAGIIGSGHSHDDKTYFASIVEALSGTEGWLVTGPAATKNEFASYVEKHASQLGNQLIGIEAMDHPTDGELLDYARRFFKAADRIRPREE
jgi:stalled ribosome rescue protein Dom34